MKNLCAPLLLALAAAPLFAQGIPADEDEPVWYRVEVLIFRYLDTSDETESWPDLPALSYPQQLRHLRSGLPDSDLRQEFVLQRIEDTVPAADFSLAWEKSAAELQRDYENSLLALAAASAPAILLGEDQTLDNAAAGPVAAFDRDAMTVPRAFVPMAEDAAEFRPQALGIRRSRDKRLMFHQSWLQPLRSRERSLAISVDGVTKEGDYPALQGSLLLYISRYLHVETNIWLNTRGTSDVVAALPAAADATTPVADAVDVWRMPPPPLPPRAYKWTPWIFQVQLDAGFSDDIILSPEWEGAQDLYGAQPTKHSRLLGGAQAPAAGAPVAVAAPIVAEFDPADILQPIVITAQRIPVLDIEQLLAQKWYPFERAVLVKQQRRMRGGELHYLDHPLLGVILRVSPYEFEPFVPPRELNGSLAGSRTEFPR